MSDGKVIFKYVGDTSDIDRANAEAEGKLHKFGAIAGKALLAIGTAAATAGAAVVKIGSDFESAFAGVVKTVNATEAELGDLRKGILDMSKELPASAAEIASVAEAAGQLGIETPNILGFTRAMIDLGESTNMTADQAATQLARFANIMQMPQTEFSKLGSAVVALGNNFATTEAEIVDMSMRLAGAGKQAGMTEADIMGFAAALSSVGIEAEAGGTAMSRVFTDINIAVQTGSDELANFAYVAGMSTDEFARAFREDAAGAVTAFIQGLGSAGSEAVVILEEMGISEIRMRDALLRASGAGDLLTQSITTSNEAWEENIALSNEASKRYETLESRFEMLKNQISAIAINIYDKLRPALSDALKGFTDLLDTLEESGKIDALAETLGELAKTLAKLITDILPVLLDLINDILQPVIEIVNVILPFLAKLFDRIMPIIKEIVDTILPVLAEILDLLLPPLIKIIDALLPVLFVVLEKILQPLMKLVGMLLPSLASILDTISVIMEALNPLFELFYDQLGPLIKTLSGGLAVALGIVADALSIVVGLIGLLIEGIKWLIGQGGNFKPYLDMVTKPFSSKGNTIRAADASAGIKRYDSPEEYIQGQYDEFLKSHKIPSNARGTNYWRGGITALNEEGPEIVDLPTGTRIYPAELSERMVSTPSISNSNNTIINEIKVYPDQEDYLKLMGLLESHESARQVARAGGK